MRRRLLEYRWNHKAGRRRISQHKWQGTVEGLEKRRLLTSGYVQLNLVSDQAGIALIQDPNLINPTGIALAPSAGDFWVSDTGSGVTTLYGGDVSGSAFSKSSLVVSVPGGSPTGQVFNGTTGFTVQSGSASGPATFILDSLGGQITGWNTSVPAPGSTQAESAKSVSGAEFTGLAEGTVGSSSFIYAADFHNGAIDVFDSSFAAATLAGSFTDPNIPAGFAPFNIQNISGNLFVTYAKQDATKQNPVAGAGNGFVDEFSTNGTIMHTLVVGNQLNAPWGIAIAPATFGDLQGDLLVANTGDGKINAFNPVTGAFVNTLNDTSGNPITISGLHGLSFGNGVSAGDASTLYFTADPSSGQHGLFGELKSATLNVAGATITATEGTAFSGVVATFSSTTTGAQASGFTASIAWGDGSTTTGSISANASAGFNVTGGHTYAEDGTDPLSVIISAVAPGTATATATGSAVVLEGNLSGAGTTFSATEALSFTGNVATFTDPNSTDTASAFTAIINWGDGTTTAGTVSGSPAGFTINGTHTYSDGGVFPTTISVNETGTSPAPAATLTGAANVTDTDTLTATGTAIAATEGTSFTGSVATFTDSNPSTAAGDLIATIFWGDGGSSAGTVTGSNGNFTVTASHIYGDEGTFDNTVVVADDAIGGGTSTVTSTATVAESDTLTPGPITFTPTEGQSFSGTVATFTSSNTAGLASDFVATIDWGDGTTTAGIIAGSNGNYTVTGTHAYANDGTESVTVSIADDAPGTATATAASTANILEGDLTGTGATFSATEGSSFSGNVATFNDAASTATAASFTATIDWGDGSGTSAGTVTGAPGGFTVSGTHTFTDGGAFPVRVFVTETGISPAPAATITALANVPDTDVLAATATAAISQTEGQTFNGTVATFSDDNLATVASDFIASIVWGDGSSSTGTVTGANGQFTVTANHAYLDEGTFTAQVTIADDATGGPTATTTTTATIAEGDQLLPIPQIFQATAGSSFSGNVATFKDNSSFNSASDFSAIIDWGDGTTTPGSVSGNGSTFTVSGTHTYLHDGSIGVNVTFFDDAPGTAEVAANSTAHVASAGLTLKNASISATERTAFSGTVATFIDPSTSDTSAQFTATINWGDGSSSAGTVTGSGGAFSVAGSHTFTSEGGSTVTVQVTDTNSAPTATFSESSTVSVLDADVLSGSGLTIAPVEGQTFSGNVATFTDVSTTAAATDFTASINWGDGSSSTGTVSGSAGTFTVSGSHTYVAGGTDSVKVTLADNPPGTATATATGTAQVASATLSAKAVNVTVTQGDVASNVTVATFTDSNPSAPASGFRATVDWGDGSSTDQVATVTGSNGTFTVAGSHTYANPGHFALTVAIQNQGGGTASASPTAVIGSNDERFVAQLYRDLLGREAEPGGMTFWDTQISQGKSRAAIATGFLGSLEFRLDVANELYQTYLQRPADLSGVTTVARALTTNTPEQEAAVLVSSTEFFTNQAFGTSDGFLTALYSDALHRQVDPGAQLSFGVMNISDPAVRAQIAAQVFGGTEYRTDLTNSPAHTAQKFNQGVPVGFYQTFLHRNADSAGLAAALAQYKAGQNDAQVIDTIVASDEYFTNL